MPIDRTDAEFFRARGTNIRVRRARANEIREIIKFSSAASPDRTDAALDLLGPTYGAPPGFEWRVAVVELFARHHAKMIVSQPVDAPEEIEASDGFAPIPIMFGSRLLVVVEGV